MHRLWYLVETATLDLISWHSTRHFYQPKGKPKGAGNLFFFTRQVRLISVVLCRDRTSAQCIWASAETPRRLLPKQYSNAPRAPWEGRKRKQNSPWLSFFVKNHSNIFCFILEEVCMGQFVDEFASEWKCEFIWAPRQHHRRALMATSVITTTWVFGFPWKMPLLPKQADFLRLC